MIDSFLLVCGIMYCCCGFVIFLTLIFEKRSHSIRRYIGDLGLGLIGPVLLVCVMLIYILFKLNMDKPAIWLNNACDKITDSILSN